MALIRAKDSKIHFSDTSFSSESGKFLWKTLRTGSVETLIKKDNSLPAYDIIRYKEYAKRDKLRGRKFHLSNACYKKHFKEEDLFVGRVVKILIYGGGGILFRVDIKLKLEGIQIKLCCKTLQHDHIHTK